MFCFTGSSFALRFALQVDKQSQSPRLARQPKTPKITSPEVKKAADLPLLDSEAPKLQHLGADRPRRPKNKPMTRPTVGLEPSRESTAESTEAVVDTGVNEFFSASLDAGAGSASPRIVNGESENPV